MYSLWYGGAFLQYLLGGICGKLSVPIFLLISGYLFFEKEVMN